MYGLELGKIVIVRPIGRIGSLVTLEVGSQSYYAACRFFRVFSGSKGDIGMLLWFNSSNIFIVSQKVLLCGNVRPIGRKGSLLS